MSRVEERLRIEPDGTVTALSGKIEYGQGLRAAYPRIVAEELGISHDRVRVVLGDTDRAPPDMGTFGSMSIEMDGLELRRAAAFARAELVARAAEALGCAPESLAVRDGAVESAVAGDRRVTFAELVARSPVSGEVPEDVRLASPTPTCPDAPLGPDARDFVTGRARFVGDLRLPGMLYGHVLHPSRYGASLRSIDRDAAMCLPGVVAVVHERDFAGVVAESHVQALAACRRLAPTWGPRHEDGASGIDAVLRADPGAAAALKSGAMRIGARYFTPHVANAPLGPSVGVVDVRADEAFVYATTQVPFSLRDAVAGLAGLPPERVHFRPMAMSGGYGRHGASDAAIEAARLSKAVGRPVMVQWGRADELRGAPNRPQMDAAVEAALDPSGRIVGWSFEAWTNSYAYWGGARLRGSEGRGRGAAAGAGGWDATQMAAMMAGRCALPAYELGAADVRVHVQPAEVRTGALRSLGASPNTFAIESFVDELALAAGADPIAFRLRHTPDPRMRRVLMAVRDASAWPQRRLDAGRGLGVACALYRKTYVAEVVEVLVAASGEVHLERVWCAVDAGHIVHPDGARSQVEGAVQMAASWTLLEELAHENGEIAAATFDDYPIATFRDAPRSVDIVFTGDDVTPCAGLGEPPAVPIAPAIANAVFAACGARVRRLPLRPEAIRQALAGGQTR